MKTDLRDALGQIARSVPVTQERLDLFYRARLQAAREAIEQVAGTPFEPVARELAPERYIAHETTIEVELKAIERTESEIGVTLFNGFLSRRYARQRNGSVKICMTLRSAPGTPER